MAILLFLGLIFSLEVPVILKLLTPDEFWVSGFIVYFAVLSRVLNAAYYHLFFGLLYAKKTFKISIIQMSTATASLAFTVPLVWAYGLMGAVIASFLSGVIQCFIAYAISTSFYRIPFQWSSITRMLILMTGLYLLAKKFTIVGTKLELWLNLYLAPWLEYIGEMLFLDRIKDGKLLHYLVNGLAVVTDGFILFLYCCLFLVGLVFLKIIPSDIVRYLFHVDTLRKPSRIFNWGN
ncbi:hypothetical protein [uncultured Desulfuromusa sp.]|uniref:hypothetical protein n=1 Tax=uncultured Desulfuromusa sp. TaxID=219183 RepID=UPI002AA6240C|nr:hypothetical protein [uncultured Desulfuromusa sp.]